MQEERGACHKRRTAGDPSLPSLLQQGTQRQLCTLHNAQAEKTIQNKPLSLGMSFLNPGSQVCK